MNLSRDSILALQRHFLGALGGAPRAWLEPLPAQPLVFTGDAIRSDDAETVLDFGTVSSPGEERRRVRVGNRSGERVNVRIAEQPAWLMASWVGIDGDSAPLGSGECAEIELFLPHDAEREFAGVLRFQIGARTEELQVRMIARRSNPIAQIDFNGSPSPRPFDFGMSEDAYVLRIANKTSIPLVTTFSDLPDFLTFEVDQVPRSGPLSGPFFERPAPFTVQLRATKLGVHCGVLRLHTNDPRAEMRNIEVHFRAFVVAAQPCVRVTPPPRVRLRADQTLTVEARLENWSRVAARTAKESVPAALAIREAPVVPAAHDGKPGAIAMPIRIAPKTLIPGAHTMTLSLRIASGMPSLVEVPVELDVDPPRRSLLRPELVAAMFAILFLALLLVILRGLS